MRMCLSLSLRVMVLTIICSVENYGSPLLRSPNLSLIHGRLQEILIMLDGPMRKQADTPRATGLVEFYDCIQEVGLMDFKLNGSQLTWSTSYIGNSRIECKLDMVLVNAAFMHSNLFTSEVLLPSISDHFLILLSFHNRANIKVPF